MVTCTICPCSYIATYLLTYYTSGEAEYSDYRDRRMKSTMVIDIKIFYKMIDIKIFRLLTLNLTQFSNALHRISAGIHSTISPWYCHHSDTLIQSGIAIS